MDINWLKILLSRFIHARRKILFQLEAKSNEKPQFTIVNENLEADFNKKMEEKICFAKVSLYLFYT